MAASARTGHGPGVVGTLYEGLRLQRHGRALRRRPPSTPSPAAKGASWMSSDAVESSLMRRCVPASLSQSSTACAGRATGAELERVVHRLVDLLDARAREAVAAHAAVVVAGLARAEQSVAARVLLDAHELGLDSRARRRAHARHLGAKKARLSSSEGADEARVRGEAAGSLSSSVPKRTPPRGRAANHHHDPGHRAREGGDQRDQHVKRR
jgi:hypothetical protein